MVTVVARRTGSGDDNIADVTQRARIGQIVGTLLGGSIMIAAWHVYLGPRPALHPLQRGESVCVKGISQLGTTFVEMQRDFPLTVRARQLLSPITTATAHGLAVRPFSTPSPASLPNFLSSPLPPFLFSLGAVFDSFRVLRGGYYGPPHLLGNVPQRAGPLWPGHRFVYPHVDVHGGCRRRGLATLSSAVRCQEVDDGRFGGLCPFDGRLDVRLESEGRVRFRVRVRHLLRRRAPSSTHG